MSGRLVRAVCGSGPPLRLEVDGALLDASTGDSVLVAILMHRGALRAHELSGEPRAGFCLMGACQDCQVWLADGTAIRACTTEAAEGMRIRTAPPRPAAAARP